MSTFYGGEQLIEIKTLEATNPPSGAATIYTVPAGRYAVITPLINVGIVGQGVEIAYKFAGTTEKSDISAGDIMYAGDQLERKINSQYYYIFIKEYLLP
mgnify:CR=1 FL=1